MFTNVKCNVTRKLRNSEAVKQLGACCCSHDSVLSVLFIRDAQRN